jgi:hypothetical protein
MKLAIVAVALAACVPGVYVPAQAPASVAVPVAAAPQPAASPEAPVEGADAGPAVAAPPEGRPKPQLDPHSPGQVIVETMTGWGYTCTALATSWQCLAPHGAWPVYVSYVPQADGSTTIWFDSWLERAYAKPCSKFEFTLHDLAATGFWAGCDDASEKFRFNTAVVYGPDLDIMGWLAHHESRRTSAGQNLRSIHGLSQGSARLLAQR